MNLAIIFAVISTVCACISVVFAMRASRLCAEIERDPQRLKWLTLGRSDP